MSRGVNKVILVGHLGADPEVRYTSNGACITSARIATSEAWKDKQSGEQQERTEWTSLTFFGRLAEIAGEYLKKGQQVYIEGKLRTEEWEKDGVKRYTTKVVVDEMQMLGGRQDGGGTRSDTKPGKEAAKQGDMISGSGQRAPQNAQAKSASGAGASSIDDDDIPFS